MASITLNPIPTQVPTASTVSGDENIVVINKHGKPSIVKVSSILNKVDSGIVDRIDDQILDIVEDQIDDMIDERLENIDPSGNLNWNDVL